VVSLSVAVGMMEATGVVFEGGGVKVSWTEVSLVAAAVVGFSVVAGIFVVARAVVFAPVTEGTTKVVGTSDVGCPVVVLSSSEVGMAASELVVAELPAVGVGVVVVTPVPTEVPAVGVMPEGVSAAVVVTPVDTPVVGVVVGVSSDVGITTLLSVVVDDGVPVVIPVPEGISDVGVGRETVVSAVGVGRIVVSVGRRDVKSVIGAVPDGNVIEGSVIGVVGMMLDRSVELNTSEVGMTRPVVVASGVVEEGAVGFEAGSVTPVVGVGRIGRSDVTCETTEETSDTTEETAEVASDATDDTTEDASETTDDTAEVASETTDDTTEVAPDTTDETTEVAPPTTEEPTEETSDTTDDKTEETPGRRGVVSDVGIGVASVVGVAGSAAVGVGAVPKAVVIPTTIPVEEGPVPEGRIEDRTGKSDGRSPPEALALEGCTMLSLLGRPPVEPGTMNGPWN
jgi:hypothetical protein